MGADVVEKTGPRRNLRILRMNRSLVAGTGFDMLYIVKCRSDDVNILGSTHSLARKSKCISVRRDKE